MVVLLDPFAQVRSGTTRVILRLMWRIVLLGVSGSVVTAAVLIAWRLTALLGLPRAKDSFDMAAFRAFEVPAERDAFDIYPVAAARFKRFANPDDWFGPLEAAVGRGWQAAGKEAQSWLIENREALDLWRQAADRPETSLRIPGGRDLLSGSTGAPFTALFLLSQLEASRRETAGDPEGAWAWHRACLRMIRHAQDYDPLRRAADFQQLFSHVLNGVKRWAEDPRIGAPLLRKALNDAQALDTPATRGSAALELEYLWIARTLANPPPELVEQAWSDLCSDGDDLLWYRHLPLFHESRWFIRNEPERSLRVARLVFANLIAGCEEPSSLWSSSATWAPISAGGAPLLLYTSPGGSVAPTPVEGLTAPELCNWYASTLLFRRLYNNNLCHKLSAYDSYMVRRRADHARLIVNLAKELYAREHGGHRPTSSRDLLGPYLKALPEIDLELDWEKPNQAPDVNSDGS